MAQSNGGSRFHQASVQYVSGSGSKPSMSGGARDMIYLTAEGRKVATPNDKRVTAEIKNRSEAVRLEFQKKILDKEIMRNRFMIKMEQKEMLNAVRVTMENSGNSSSGKPPSGPNDRAHETSPYFTNPGRLSMRRMCKWRVEEKQLQRMLREQEASIPPFDIERDSGYYKEFLEMLNSLGLSRAEDSREDNTVLALPPTQPPPSVTRDGREMKKKAGKDINMNKKGNYRGGNPRPVSTEPVDVFECLKSDSRSMNATEMADIEYIERTGPISSTVRAKSAPCTTAFSVRQWEKDMVDNYIKIASRPASAITTSERKCRKKLHARPNSAPVHIQKDIKPTVNSSVGELDTICERYTKHRTGPPKKPRPHSVNCPRGMRKKNDSVAGPPKRPKSAIVFHSLKAAPKYYKRGGHICENVTAIQKDTEEASEIGRDSTKYNRKAAWVEQGKTVSITDAPVEGTQKVDSNDLVPNALQIKFKPKWKSQSPNLDHPRDPHTRPTDSTKYVNTLGVIHSDSESNHSSAERYQTGQSIQHTRFADSAESVNSEDTLLEDGNHVSQWRRDLCKEAPPGLFSTRSEVKVNVTMSKVERQRKLDLMVRDHTYEIKTLIQKERMRKVKQRVKAVVTISKVDQAAQAAKAALSRPRTDRDLLREIM